MLRLNFDVKNTAWHGFSDDDVRFAVGYLITRYEDRVRKCPKCESIFFSSYKGKKYCSHQCAVNVARNRHYHRYKK